MWYAYLLVFRISLTLLAGNGNPLYAVGSAVFQRALLIASGGFSVFLGDGKEFERSRQEPTQIPYRSKEGKRPQRFPFSLLIKTMSLGNCFPDWLVRYWRDRIGPNIPDAIPYPVYVLQPPVRSADNKNGSSIYRNDAFYQKAAGQIAVAALPTTIIHVTPMENYDTINVVAFVSPAPFATAARAPGVPIFFSFEHPGRIVNEVALNQGSLEAFVATATAFVPTDFSSYPTCIKSPDVILNNGLTAPVSAYSNFLLPTVKTDRPFYFWFGDSLAVIPPDGSQINFCATWYVQGR